MADTDIVQVISEARIDARSLSEFVFKPAGFKVARRLAPPVDTLQFYIDRFNSLDGDFSSSVSVALSSLNSSVAEADGKVAYIETTVQDAINNTVISSGFVTVDSFELGATLTQRNQALRHAADGRLYRWAGDLPKAVPTNSTPTSSGGMGDNAWLEVSDVTLRQDLTNPSSGPALVGYDDEKLYPAGTVGRGINEAPSGGSAAREPISSRGGISFGVETPRPVVSFIDDDARIEVWTKLKPFYDAKGITAGIAVPTDAIGSPNFMTWNQIRELAANGWEILSHTKTNLNIGGKSEDVIDSELRLSREAIEAQGLWVRSFVPVQGADGGAIGRRLIRKYFRGSFMTLNGIQPVPMSNYRVIRVNAVEPDEANNPSLSTLKGFVDAAIATNNWVVFATHAGYNGLTETQLQVIGDLIDYIKSQGVEIVNPDEGLDIVGNRVDVGDDIQGPTVSSPAYFKIDRYGESWPKKNSYETAKGRDGNSPITDFLTNCTTIIRPTASEAGLPSRHAWQGASQDVAGIWETVHLFQAGTSHGVQRYYPRNTTAGFVRVWDTIQNKWGNWEITTFSNPYGVRPSAIDGSSPITDYKPNAVSTYRTASGDSGWPTSGTYVIETNHLWIHESESYGHQIAHSTTGASGSYYRLWVRSSSQWSDWVSVLGDSGSGSGSETNLLFYNDSALDGNSPITDYPENKKIITRTFASAQGWPTTGIFVVESYRYGRAEAYGKQVAWNRETGEEFKRYWLHNATDWTDWMPMSPLVGAEL